MTKFIWIRDSAGAEHYINVNHIIRVTKRHPDSTHYLTLIKDGEISLSQDTYDTVEDVISKIGAAS